MEAAPRAAVAEPEPPSPVGGAALTEAPPDPPWIPSLRRRQAVQTGGLGCALSELLTLLAFAFLR